jgi:hypothetical protein
MRWRGALLQDLQRLFGIDSLRFGKQFLGFFLVTG